MEFRKLFKKWLNSTCIIFTIAIAFYALLKQITNIDDPDASVDASMILMIFIFSNLLSIANIMLSIEKIHLALRYVCHYLISIFGFWTCLCLPNKMNFSRTFIGIVIFSVGYAILMLAITFFKHRINKIKNPETNYEKQFSNKNK